MKKLSAAEMIKALNEKIKQQESQDKSAFGRRKTFNFKPKMFKGEINTKEDLKKTYPIESYIPPLKRKNHTNFEEMIRNYENIDYFKPKELEDIIIQLKEVHIFYQEKLKQLEKDLENPNKLYVYRFKKVKAKMEIFKLFEIITDIMFYFIEYIKIESPDDYQKEMYSKKISKAQEIFQLKKEEEANTFYRDPKLEEIKFFENTHTEQELKEKSKNNTIIKTMDDNFEIQKDCHIIKNEMLDFVPKIELDFSENIEMNEELFKVLKSELKEILGEDNFSIIEMNRGSFHVLITLQFLLNKLHISAKEEIKNLSEKCRNLLGKFSIRLNILHFLEKRKKYKCSIP